MKENINEMTRFVEALPEKALLPYFMALLHVAKESAVITFAKKVTTFIQHTLSWFIMGTMITGLIWVIVFLFDQIKNILK